MSDLKCLMPSLGGLLRWERKPYNLEAVPQFEPMFKTTLPQRSVWKTGRQVGKSVSLAGQGYLLCMIYNGLRIAFILPLYSQAKDFASDKLNMFIDYSPVLSDYMLDTSHHAVVDAWQRKVFRNRSSMHMGYILTNPDRVRGPSYDILNMDEFQDWCDDLIPIVESCITASELEVMQMTGTSLSTTCILETMWRQSSQAEWAIPCTQRGCKEYNIPSAEADLIDMIHEDGLHCAHCGAELDPVHPEAKWVHGFPDRRAKLEGHHVPQVILPIHQRPRKWERIIDRYDKWSKAHFYNEVLGEAQDTGHKRISEAEIKAACVLPRRTRDKKRKLLSQYSTVAIGADWGGKGAKQVSRTAYAVIGRRKSSAKYDLIDHKIFPASESTANELAVISNAYEYFNCDFLAYDAHTDPGYELSMNDYTDIPKNKCVAMMYVPNTSADKDIIYFNDKGPRPYYTLDKTRSLLVLFMAIKKRLLRFPPWEDFEDAAQDILSFEDTISRRRGQEVVRITRAEGSSDDLGDAINYALTGILSQHDEFRHVIGSKNQSLRTLVSEQ